MPYLIDIVNLNADASCLSSKWWLKILSGGKSSYFYKWLKIYVDAGKKVSIGFTGAAIADISTFNPEAIEFINNHRNIFEIILRPFSHDVGLLRSTKGFQINLEAGIKTIKHTFSTYTNFYLPPEFMLTNEQVAILVDNKIDGTFINAARFKTEIFQRLPEHPYKVKGLFDSELRCIPFTGALTQAFLNGIHFFNADEWNKLVAADSSSKQPSATATATATFFSWRDGESSFLIPNGNSREQAWLKAESKQVQRIFLSETLPEMEFDNSDNLKENHYHHYPIHSFTAWMKEFRMIGFVNKILDFEKNISKMQPDEIALWLQVINSDILSSVEKDSPVIKLKLKEGEKKVSDYTIWRCERGMEGEEILLLLEEGLNNKKIKTYLKKSDSPHIQKLKARIEYLKKII
jgi:hypothetical protein